MIFTEITLKGAYLIALDRHEDERGFFARSWCAREFADHGLDSGIKQCNISFNKKRGTLRGMHYQAAPYQEVRLVRCTRGRIHDVIIDLRSSSPTHMQHFAIVLSGEQHNMLYVPKGFAHGFITLDDNVEIFYQMSEFYQSEYARGVRWNDPAFHIHWPIEVTAISKRDQQYVDYSG